jgi:transcriptional regulator with XRE-family HTH domain
MDFAFATCNEILQELGARLRAQRLAQSLTQQQLADMASVSLGTIKTLERSGSSSLETLVRVVQALGLADDLASLFELKLDSIAHMQALSQAQRQRASRPKNPWPAQP